MEVTLYSYTQWYSMANFACVLNSHDERARATSSYRTPLNQTIHYGGGQHGVDKGGARVSELTCAPRATSCTACPDRCVGRRALINGSKVARACPLARYPLR